MVEVRPSRFRERVSISMDPEKGRTKQQFRDEVNINTIMHKYRHSGIVPKTRGDVGHYGHFEDVTTYDQAVDAVNNANQAFAELPADVRSRFENDPQQLLDFMATESNEEEARALGILPPLETEDDDDLELVEEDGEPVVDNPENTG